MKRLVHKVLKKIDTIVKAVENLKRVSKTISLFALEVYYELRAHCAFNILHLEM